jgi:serine/threonine protein kinase
LLTRGVCGETKKNTKRKENHRNKKFFASRFKTWMFSCLWNAAKTLFQTSGEHKEAPRTYSLVKELGGGMTSRVHSARTGSQNVALKLVSIEFVSYGLREVSILQSFNHENVIQLITHFITTDDVVLVLPLYSMNLASLLRKRALDVHEQRSFLRQLLSAVAYSHENGVLHLDIKPSNIMIRGENLVLADFGLALRIGEKPYQSEFVTLPYRAPELLLCKKVYERHVDMYSVGCVFYELVMRQLLFARVETTTDFLKEVDKMYGSTYAFIAPSSTAQDRLCDYLKRNTNEISPEGVDLLSQMLHCDSSKRISAKQALSHAFFVQ